MSQFKIRNILPVLSNRILLFIAFVPNNNTLCNRLCNEQVNTVKHD